MIDKSLRILFCYPNQYMRATIPGGIAILSACLKREGFYNLDVFDSTWFDQNLEDRGCSNDRDRKRAELGLIRDYSWEDFGFSKEEEPMHNAWRTKVLEFKPDVIISSIVEDTYYIWDRMMKVIEDIDFTSIVGGVFPTSRPDCFVGKCDYICRGEGDEAIPEMINNISQGKRCDSVLNVYPNSLRPAVDVETLPISDHDIFPERSLYRPFLGKIYKHGLMETQRGCPFGCKFCNSPEKNLIYNRERAGKFFRRRSIPHIKKEADYLVYEKEVDLLWIITDTLLTMPDQEFDDFCDLMETYENVSFFAQTRPTSYTISSKTLKEGRMC